MQEGGKRLDGTNPSKSVTPCRGSKGFGSRWEQIEPHPRGPDVLHSDAAFRPADLRHLYEPEPVSGSTLEIHFPLFRCYSVADQERGSKALRGSSDTTPIFRLLEICSDSFYRWTFCNLPRRVPKNLVKSVTFA